MAAIVWADVVAAAPQTAAVTPAWRTSILAYVNTTLDVDIFGGEASPKLKMLRTLLAAHYGEMWIRRGNGGAVDREELAAESIYIAYAPPHWGTPLSATSYGELYQGLIDSSPARVGFVP